MQRAAYFGFSPIFKVAGAKCILACYNMAIPYLMPSLPAEQKAALAFDVKVPVLSASVLLKSGRPFAKLGAASFFSPGRLLHEHFGWGRSFGSHSQPFNPDQPTTMFMIAPPTRAHSGLKPREQYRVARAEMLATPFETYELEIREHLQGLFGETGFNAAEDIVSLTLNRWGHGYSYELNPLFDGPFAAGQLPYEIGRRPFGNVAIANADSAMAPHAIDAIEQAERAVRDILRT
jgi:spermidine dehydrogenase